MSAGITIREMEDVARGMGGGPDINLSSEIGNVINLSDMGDDLGMNLLANQSKISVNPSSSSSSGPSIQIPMGMERGNRPSGGGVSFGGLEEIDITPLEPISIDANIPMGGSAPAIEIRKESSGDVGANLFSNQQSATGPSLSLSSSNRDPEREKAEKIEYINKLQRLESKGFPVSKHFTMDNSLDEIKQEYTRLVDARNLEGSLRFQRQMLMGVVTGLEWMNNKFDPFDLKLEGWSESVHENVEDFDEIFEELYDKYKDRGKMAPEMRLMVALAGSGFMCHVSNSFFRQKMPTMDDVLRNNPQLARQMAAAAAQQAGPGFGNFMGMAMGMNGGMPTQAMPGPSASEMPAPQPMPQAASTGAFFQSSRVPNVPQPVASVEPPRATARREMRGPSGVEDILKTFEEVRRAEAQEVSMPPNITGPTNQPAVAAAVEIQSLHSDDMRSQAESQRTSGGRRRRKAAVPDGNVLSLNV